MKKIFLIAVCIMFISCDPSVYLDFNVQNNCEQAIIVNATIDNYKVLRNTIDTIYPKSHKCIYQRVEILGFYKNFITSILLDISVIKDSKNINYNPVDTARWQFSQTGKYNYEAILTVNPKDFE